MHTPAILPSRPFKVYVPTDEKYQELSSYLKSHDVTVVGPFSTEHVVVYDLDFEVISRGYIQDFSIYTTYFQNILHTATDLTNLFFPETAELTVEEIFILFLKQHRVYSTWKQTFTYPFDSVPIFYACYPNYIAKNKQSPKVISKWETINNKWILLCDHFNLLNKQIHITKLNKL